MLSIKAVLFDIGSTLIEGPKISPAKKISQMLVGDFSLKREISALVMTTRIGSPAELAAVLGKKWGGGNIDLSLLEGIWGEQLRGAVVKEGAEELYRHCRTLGLKTAFISNIWQPYYESFARTCPEMEKDADHRFLSFEMGVEKPNPEMFTRALNGLGLPAGKVVIIGDTYDCDIEPAIGLGMKTIWFLHRPENESASIERIGNGSAKKPGFTVSTLSEIRETKLLEKL